MKKLGKAEIATYNKLRENHNKGITKYTLYYDDQLFYMKHKINMGVLRKLEKEGLIHVALNKVIPWSNSKWSDIEYIEIKFEE